MVRCSRLVRCLRRSDRFRRAPRSGSMPRLRQTQLSAILRVAFGAFRNAFWTSIALTLLPLYGACCTNRCSGIWWPMCRWVYFCRPGSTARSLHRWPANTRRRSRPSPWVLVRCTGKTKCRWQRPPLRRWASSTFVLSSTATICLHSGTNGSKEWTARASTASTPSSSAAGWLRKASSWGSRDWVPTNSLADTRASAERFGYLVF